MKTKFYLTLTTLCVLAVPVFGQSYLAPEKPYDVATWLPDYQAISAFDFTDTLFYLHDGDTIRQLGISSGVEYNKYGEPADYTASSYVSFLSVSPDGSTIWTGYTSSENLDDRIYSIDAESGEWELRARFPANMDLVFWKDSILVSGLNSSSWDAPAAIFVLDASGANAHRRIIEPGGYSAGMALDQEGNLYYGTSYAVDPNALYLWDNSLLELVIEIPGKPILQVAQAEKLSDLPSGVYDCEVDEGGNVLFNMNLEGGPQALAMWNGIPGDGINIDTLATASGEWDWLGILKSTGDITLGEPGNMVLTHSFGQSLAKVTRKYTVGVEQDFAPEIIAYPNPSPGIFTIGTGSTEMMEVDVYTLHGCLVYTKGDFLSGSKIDISMQPAGSYIVRVTSKKGITGKMIQKL